MNCSFFLWNNVELISVLRSELSEGEKKNLAKEHRTSKTHHSVLELCTVCVTGANYFLLLAVRKASLLQGSIISSIQKTKDLKKVKNQKPFCFCIFY